MPFEHALGIAATDTFPPLSTIIMWPWVRLFGDGEIMTRLPALLLGAASIYLIGLLGKQWFEPKVGLLAASFLATSRIGIYFSTEARQYALFLFLTLLTWYFFTQKNKKRYFLSGLLLLMSHTYAIFPLAFTYIWGIPENKDKRKPWHLKHGVLTILYGLWAAFALTPKLPDLLTNSWFLTISAPKGWPLALFSTPVVSSEDSWIFWITTGIVISLIISVVLPAIAARKRIPSMLFAMTVCSVVIAWLAGPPKLKYFIFAMPLVFLLLSYAIINAEKKWRSLYGGVLLLVMIGSSFSLISNFRFSWDLVADYAQQQAAPVLIPWSVNAIPFAHYYGGEFSVIPAPGTSATSIESIAQTSWKWNLNKQHITKQLEMLAPTSTKLIIIQSDPYVQGVEQWLQGRGYQKEETISFDKLNSVSIEHYYKKTDPT